MRDSAASRFEGTAAKKRYTIEDYYALPEEKRVELIDGVFYDMAAPSYLHQDIIGEIFGQLWMCQNIHRGACRVHLSPCDVQLDQDIYTMVQPDLVIICDPEKIQKRVCYGAPDLTMEILSPSSRSRDAVLKLRKYQQAGVREYWIIDPENRIIHVYEFEKNGFRSYEFTDTVPVGISDGKCAVDFRQICENLGLEPELELKPEQKKQKKPEQN